jgi:hypothetical protein
VKAFLRVLACCIVEVRRRRRPARMSAKGSQRRPPRPAVFEIPIWNLISSASSLVIT